MTQSLVASQGSYNTEAISSNLIDAAGAARPHAGDTEHLPVVNASARGARRYIDGQRCAARLIAHMSLAAQDRVLDALDDEAPGTAKRLLDRMYQFGDVATLTALDLRTLLRELDPLVLKVALGGRRCRDLEQHSRCTAKARACFTDNGHG